jgi:hypothetical protein
MRRDAVEDLATAAIKEEGIEAKLGAIALEWGEAQLTFQDYKTRGAVVLKARPRIAHCMHAHCPCAACMRCLIW